MSLDIYFSETRPCEVYEGNITHNCGTMARELGIYDLLWGGEAREARQLIIPLSRAIVMLRDKTRDWSPYTPTNGWGTAEQFANFLEEVRDAAALYPNATVEISK